jgi:hypothetical protein
MPKLLLLLFLLGAPVANRWIGTWTLDPDASRLAGPVPRELWITIAEADETMIRYTLSGTDAGGKAFREPLAIPPDGRFHLLSAEGKETASYRWTPDGVLRGETAGDPDGVVKTFTVELSGDGRSLIEKRQVKTPAGESEVVLVFRRGDRKGRK